MTLMWPQWFPLALGAMFGGVLGSFLNVCIYRIPRDLSVVFPPSSCPHCGTRIAPYDNVPVLAWLWLRGRCRSCREPISWRYPAVEAFTAVLFAYLVWRFGLTWELLPALVFTAAMVVVTLVDFDAYIIPDAITLPGIAIGLASTFVTPVTLLDGVLGALEGYAFLFGLAWVYKRTKGIEGMGEGDFKLAAMLGAFLGWAGVLLVIFLASFAGTLAGLALMLAGRGEWRTKLPFGAFLAPVGVVVYLWGPVMIQAWLNLMRP